MVISGVPKLSITLVCGSKLYGDRGLVGVLEDLKLFISWAKLLVEVLSDCYFSILIWHPYFPLHTIPLHIEMLSCQNTSVDIIEINKF